MIDLGSIAGLHERRLPFTVRCRERGKVSRSYRVNQLAF
jgi:hypothetical protein